MAGLFSAQASFVTRTPWITVAIMGVLTLGFGAGTLIESPSQDQTAAFLPADSDLAQAQITLGENFATTNTVTVQVLLRGDVLEPAAIEETLALMAAVTDDPTVSPTLAGAPFSYAHALVPLLGGRPLADMTRADVDAALAAAADDPQTAPLAAAVQGMVARDGDAVIGGMGLVPIDGNLEEATLTAAQLAVDDAVAAFDYQNGEARSFSGAKLNQEIEESQGTSTSVLMGAALGIILLVLIVFYRTGSDVLLSMAGLIITIVWVFGLQGILGPGGIGLLGGNNPLSTMIPVLLIGLTVDYALQFTARYRELVGESKMPAGKAAREAVRTSGMPLLLAAGTTAISFLTNISSGLAPMRDFGIVAALGVMCGWAVMTTFIPAARLLVDRSRVRRGKPLQTRLMSDAIPGVGALITRTSDILVRHPVPVLLVAVVATSLSFWGAANVSTTFDQTDFLPEDTDSYQDLLFMQESFAGSSGSSVTMLVEGDLTDLRLLTVLSFIEEDLNDARVRPDGITGPVSRSLFTLIFDWADDSGLPGDKYDPAFAGFLANMSSGAAVSPDDIQAMYDQLAGVDPAGFSSVAALDVDGRDLSIITVPIDPAYASSLVGDLETLGMPVEDFGGRFTPTGGDLLSVVIVDEMTESQIQSVVITILAALVVLSVFFGITEKRPVLGLIAVLPIALVVGWVLGSMYLLGISYNVMTALITALTIGVGVDYTIHVTHRFLEEKDEGKGLRHAVHESLRTTGGALIGSALTTALGFGVLIFSPLTPMQQFGGLTALTILYSLFASILVLPPMLVLWALWTEWRGKEQQADRPTEAVFRIGGFAGHAGRTVRCPRCRTQTFVPLHVEGLRCPSLTCDFEGPAPMDEA